MIAGGRDFPEFVVGATAIAGAITGARHELIAAAGHLVPLDRPAEFQAVLLPFLRRHAPAR